MQSIYCKKNRVVIF